MKGNYYLMPNEQTNVYLQNKKFYESTFLTAQPRLDGHKLNMYWKEHGKRQH